LGKVFYCCTDACIAVDQHDIPLLESARYVRYPNGIQTLIPRQIFAEKGREALADDAL
jgi:hypothetical protein